MDDKTLLWLLGIAVGIIQSVFLFLWNNLRADIKELKEMIITKASADDLEKRRQDIMRLYEQDTEINKEFARSREDILIAMHQMETRILGELTKFMMREQQK